MLFFVQLKKTSDLLFFFGLKHGTDYCLLDLNIVFITVFWTQT